MSVVVQWRQSPFERIYQGERVNNSCWVTCSTPLAVCPLVIGTTPFSVYFARSFLLLCYQRGTWVGLDSVWHESWTATQPSYLTPPPLFHFVFSTQYQSLCLPVGEPEIIIVNTVYGKIVLQESFLGCKTFSSKLNLLIDHSFFLYVLYISVCLPCVCGCITNVVLAPFTLLLYSICKPLANYELCSILAIFISLRMKTRLPLFLWLPSLLRQCQLKYY